jgi:hypothetical protein
VRAFAQRNITSTALAYTPTANGCGPENGPKVPNYFSFWNPFGRTDRYPFVNACNRHDICYGTLGSNRAACDQQFLSDLLAICAANGSTAVSRTYCRGLAYTYYGAVAAFGGWAFDAAQAKARAG